MAATRLGQLQKRTGPIASEGKTDRGVRAKVDVDAIMAMIDSLEQEIEVGNSSLLCLFNYLQFCPDRISTLRLTGRTRKSSS